MKISKDQVLHIAKLSFLNLKEEEIFMFQNQLNNILLYIEKLNSLDTKNIEPTSHTVPINNIFREDIIKPSLPIEEAIRNAPDKYNKFYRVPKIIE